MSSVYNLVLGVSKDMSRMGEDVELQVKGKERKYIMELGIKSWIQVLSFASVENIKN